MTNGQESVGLQAAYELAHRERWNGGITAIVNGVLILLVAAQIGEASGTYLATWYGWVFAVSSAVASVTWGVKICLRKRPVAG